MYSRKHPLHTWVACSGSVEYFLTDHGICRLHHSRFVWHKPYKDLYRIFSCLLHLLLPRSLTVMCSIPVWLPDVRHQNPSHRVLILLRSYFCILAGQPATGTPEPEPIRLSWRQILQIRRNRHLISILWCFFPPYRLSIRWKSWKACWTWCYNAGYSLLLHVYRHILQSPDLKSL